MSSKSDDLARTADRLFGELKPVTAHDSPAKPGPNSTLSPGEALRLAESLRSATRHYDALIEYVRGTVEQSVRLADLLRNLRAMSDGYTLRHEGIEIALEMADEAVFGCCPHRASVGPAKGDPVSTEDGTRS